VAFSGDCQIICGKETIPWNLYVTAARFLLYEESIDELDPQAWKSYLSIEVRDDSRNSLLISPDNDGGERTIQLLTTGLSHVRHLQATNPKDKIYGLYAIFSTLNISLPAPDYGKPLEKIYEEACVAIISNSRSLRMLGYASSNSRAQNLPSWVPDWQDENVSIKHPSAGATNGSRISQTHLSTLSPASGQLRVRGQIVGLITARAENDFATLKFPSGSMPILKEERYELVGDEVDTLRMLLHSLKLFREWMQLVDGLASSYLDEDTDDFFHKLLTFNASSSFNSEGSDTRFFNAWVDILQYPHTSYDLSEAEKVAESWKKVDVASAHHWSDDLFHCSVVAAALLTASASRNGQVAPEMAELLGFMAYLSGNIGNRVLVFVHDPLLNETLPGTGFHTAMAGDAIVLLEGADDPVMLRKKDDKWLFIGPAFVLGIMKGEAWLDDDGTVQDLEDFVLI